MLLSDLNFETQAENGVDVLIVEDEPTARRALRTLLSARGYQTDAVSSAEDALTHVARDGAPKVALVDLDLPGMSGLELIRRLEVLSPTIFPVLITAAATDIVEKIRRQVPLAYFQKPVDFDRLMTLIDMQQLG
jgi:DNA-binding NtrC family response regulator